LCRSPVSESLCAAAKITLFGRIDQSAVRGQGGHHDVTKNLEVQGLEEKQLKETNIEVFEVLT
jgi:hypothetical protein